VRDAQGRKMSKSLGNVIDPLDLIDRYGTDALRFTLAEHATGQDIFLNTEWVSGARNFANKLWNAARFVLSNTGDAGAESWPDPSRLDLSDRWILSRLEATTDEVTRDLEAFEIASAARAIYEFIWNEFCDWYIEAAKVRLYSQDEEEKQAALPVLIGVLDQALRLAHPIMPFITEEIWQMLPIDKMEPSIMMAPWPESHHERRDEAAERNFGQIQEVVSAIRTFRSEYRIDPKLQIRAFLVAEDGDVARDLESNAGLIRQLARLSDASLHSVPMQEVGARLVAGQVDIFIPLQGLIDVESESSRLAKALESANVEIKRLQAKLGNQGFLSKAPPEVVAEQRRRLEEQENLMAKLDAQISQLRDR
jgi:valyl-tRNA synthetase